MSEDAPTTIELGSGTQGRITIWEDAQRQYEDIGQRLQPLGALHAVTVLVDTARPTLGRAAAVAIAAVAAVVSGPAAVAVVVVANPEGVQGRAGREPVRPCRTRLSKYSHSRQSAKPLRNEQRSNPTFATSSYATHGTTDGGLPKSCTSCLKRLVSKFGSVRGTLALVSR